MFGLARPQGGRLVSESIVLQAERERADRKTRIDTAWSRYWGDYPQPLLKSATDPKAADNTTVNMARRTVDISAFYLFGKDITFEVGDAKESTTDTWLKDCWAANRQTTLLLEFATGAGVSGDGFLRLYPATPGGNGFPRIVALDTSTVTAEWEPTDCSIARRFLIEFNSVDWDTKKAVAHRHRIEKRGTGWMIYEESANPDTAAGTWNVESEEAWNYPFPPVFHCKNRPAPHSYYGASDIEGDVLAINAAINFVLSNINRILRIHGHPLIYVAGQRLENVNRAVDSILQLANPEGRVDKVPSVEQLDAHFSQLQKLRDAYHELTSIPEVVTGKLENVGQLSGLALQILHGPLLQLTTVKRAFYGEMLVELCKALLTLGKQGDNLPVTIVWPQILPTNRKEEAETADALVAVGVSKSTVLTELGYNAEDEAKKRGEETDEELERQKQAFDRGNLTNNQNPFGGDDGG